MPEPVPSPQVPGQPPAAAGAPPGQPPFGSSPATAPTQNRGLMVAGIKMVGMALMALEQAVPLLGANSDPGKDVLQTISRLSKHVPPGTVTPADMKLALEKMMMQQQQFGQQMQQMRGPAVQPQQPGAAPGSPPGGAPPPQMQPRAA